MPDIPQLFQNQWGAKSADLGHVHVFAQPQSDEVPRTPWLFQPGAVTVANLTNLHTKIDQFFVRVLDKYPDEMSCRRQCSGCCHQSLSLTGVEMARVVSAVDRLDNDTRMRLRNRLTQKLTPDVCPLLEDDLCIIYDDRPTICRSHGVPIHVTDNTGRVVRDVCPLNFSGGGNLNNIPGDFVLDIDRINQILGVIQHLAAQSGEVPTARLAMRDVLAARLTTVE
ncbi:MAG: YkgJ family cysteine cluster protein [Myxococcales bacterium]|nr:YkgJ family cysteine cluster protein [Myxococcales bacterium]